MGVLLYVYTRRVERFKALFRISSILFAGSFAELLAAVPAHLIVIRRPGCLVGVLTMLGIVSGVYVMTWTFGPGLALLFMREAYKQQRKYPLCLRCGYNLTGTLQSGRLSCPECGTQVEDETRSRFASLIPAGESQRGNA